MRLPILSVLSVAVVAIGCSESPTPSGVAETSTSATSETVRVDPAVASSAEAFMRAILSGDSSVAAKLLTKKATQRFASDPTVLSSMGMRFEQLEIGEVRMLDADEAAAQCFVIEPGVDAPQELCCLLKREPAGWRVCGMAADIEGANPTVINFEEAPESAGQLVEQPSSETKVPKTAANSTETETR